MGVSKQGIRTAIHKIVDLSLGHPCSLGSTQGVFLLLAPFIHEAEVLSITEDASQLVASRGIKGRIAHACESRRRVCYEFQLATVEAFQLPFARITHSVRASYFFNASLTVCTSSNFTWPNRP